MIAPRYRWRTSPTAPPVKAHVPYRAPKPGEQCGCGRPATVVFLTERNGEIPSCGEKPPRPRPFRPEDV